MSATERIYLDNAATSWPKPEAVYEAVDRYQRTIGAPAGRSSYTEAAEVAREVALCRKLLADLIQAEGPDRIVFTAGGTDSLNLAIHGLLQPGDHVITSAADHNSVLRPLGHHCRRDVQVTCVPCDGRGLLDPDHVRRALRPETRLVALTHASNVSGGIQPVAEVAQIAREAGILYLLDAAQTLGHLPVSVRDLQVDLIASPGHKGLLGPLGTGLLYLRPGLESQLRSVRQGGTGTRSQEDQQPDLLPDKLEAGNLNVPGIFGLAAGVRFLHNRGLEGVREHAGRLRGRLRTGLAEIPGVTILGPDSPADCVGVLSITLAGIDPQEVAAVLDSAYRIQVRAGLHCAPRIHEFLGTLGAGGTVRFSVGVFNTEEQVDAAVSAVREIALSY